MSSKDIDLLRLCVAFPHIQKINDFLNVLSFLLFIKRIHTVKQNDIFEVVCTKVTEILQSIFFNNKSNDTKYKFSQTEKKSLVLLNVDWINKWVTMWLC